MTAVRPPTGAETPTNDAERSARDAQQPASGAAGTAIDHVAIVVASLEAAIPLYRDGMGLDLLGTEEVASEGVRVAMLDASVPGTAAGGAGHGAGPRIELLEPTDGESGVARFLQRHGPGIHHLALRVADIDEALKRARVAGLEVLEPAPRPGAGGSRVAFLHPRSTQGVLVEFVERPPAG